MNWFAFELCSVLLLTVSFGLMATLILMYFYTFGVRSILKGQVDSICRGRRLEIYDRDPRTTQAPIHIRHLHQVEKHGTT